MGKVLEGGYDRITASGSHEGKEGYAVNAAGAVLASAVEPYGVIIRDNDPAGESVIALPQCPDKIEVRLHTVPGTIGDKGVRLILHTDGTFKADPGTGARVVAAISSEARAAGTAGEGQLLKARLIVPIIYAS